LKRQSDVAKRIEVDQDHQFVGFDGYKQVIASDVDVVSIIFSRSSTRHADHLPEN
jgi:hypothetical protein